MATRAGVVRICGSLWASSFSTYSPFAFIIGEHLLKVFILISNCLFGLLNCRNSSRLKNMGDYGESGDSRPPSAETQNPRSCESSSLKPNTHENQKGMPYFFKNKKHHQRHHPESEKTVTEQAEMLVSPTCDKRCVYLDPCGPLRMHVKESMEESPHSHLCLFYFYPILLFSPPGTPWASLQRQREVGHGTEPRAWYTEQVHNHWAPFLALSLFKNTVRWHFSDIYLKCLFGAVEVWHAMYARGHLARS